MAGPVEPGFDHADSPNVRIVKGVFDELNESGLEAAIEHLLSYSHADVELRPYAGAGEVLRGAEAVRAFYRAHLESGTVMMARPVSFEERSDDVIVNGSIRVSGPTGGFAESQISWTYRFRDGRLQAVSAGPRQSG